MSESVHEAWSHGKLERAEEILSKEITNPDCPEFVKYSLANRALVRARLRKWDEALEDAQTNLVIRTSSSMPSLLNLLPTEANNVDVPLITYVAKVFVLLGQGKRQEATEAFDIALCICDDDAKPSIELTKVR